MGFYRGGEPVVVDGLSDVIFDTPHVAAAQQALRAARDQAATDADAFVWVGLFQPTKAELATVGSIFDLDPHQVEDAGNSHQRAKVDFNGEETFVVLKVLTFVPETQQVEVGQVAVFLGPSYLVTVRHGTTRDLREIRDRLLLRPGMLRPGRRPTGAGKTVVGEFAVHLALLTEGASASTPPRSRRCRTRSTHDLVRPLHGAAGSACSPATSAVNGEAPVVVMTTEVLRNMLYAGSTTLAGLGFVVMDEVHYLADRFRGAVWEEVIIHLPESVPSSRCRPR
jgi:hypothetical protein